MAITRHAVVDGNGKVVNITIVDPQATTWVPPSGCALVDSPLCASANLGDTWTGSAFTPGPGPAPRTLTPAEQACWDFFRDPQIDTAIAADPATLTVPQQIARKNAIALRALMRVVRQELAS